MRARWLVGSGVVLAALVAAGVLALTHSAATAAGPDFSRDQEANSAAAGLAQTLTADLSKLPGYAGIQIVRYGVEVDAAGGPTDAMRAAAARDAQRYQGQPIPVRFRSVRYSERELQAVMERIRADKQWMQAKGIEVSMCGPDIVTNTVQFRLVHYTDRHRDDLLARYGGLVSVYPQDYSASGL